MILRAVRRFLEDLWLRFYFGVILEAASFFGAYAYRLVDSTGHLFRSEENYASTFGRGVLKAASDNLIKLRVADPETGSRLILKNYLKFESRFALENIWIREDRGKYIRSAFDPSDVEKLSNLLYNGNCIIATPHTPALYMLVYLIESLTSAHGAASRFVVMNPLLNAGSDSTPLQESIVNLFSVWSKRGRFIFMEDGDVFERCGSALEAGESVIIAPDTPSDAAQKVTVDFMGAQVKVAPGAAILAGRYGVPLIAVTPAASDPLSNLRLDIETVYKSGEVAKSDEIEDTMGKIFSLFESSIRSYPSFWHGWLYWHHMY